MYFYMKCVRLCEYICQHAMSVKAHWNLCLLLYTYTFVFVFCDMVPENFPSVVQLVIEILNPRV